MSGGPGAGLQDPYIQALGFKRGTLASERCYVDSIEAWSVNEVTINWNAPFAWVVSFLQDEAPNVSDSDEDKLVVTPSKVEVEVGETDTIKPNKDGCTFESADPSIATVDENGVVTGVAKGETTITVTLGDETVEVKVIVTDESTNPTESFNPDDLMYGDANVDETVDSADIVVLNKYLLSEAQFPLKNAKAYEQAQTVYDDEIDTKDAVAIINYVLGLIDMDDLGPAR